MIITWTTLDYVNETIVEYGVNNFEKVTIGTEKIFKNGIFNPRNVTIHQVLLNDLIPGQTYSKLHVK